MVVKGSQSSKYMTSLTWAAIFKDLRIIVSITLVLSFLFGGAILIHLIEGVREGGQAENEWDFVNSLYFMAATLTTIGYGDLAPKTELGKAFVVIWTFFGLVAVFYSVGLLAQKIINTATLAQEIAQNRLGGRRKRNVGASMSLFGKSDEVEVSSTYVTRNPFMIVFWGYHRVIYSFLILFLMILLGAVVFMETEDWSYGNALYFCYISAATIGYGDFAPESNAGRLFLVVYSFSVLGFYGFILGEVELAFVHKMERKVNKKIKRMTHGVQQIEPLTPEVIRILDEIKKLPANERKTLLNAAGAVVVADDAEIRDEFGVEDSKQEANIENV